MKKFFALLLAATMLLPITACGISETPAPTAAPKPIETRTPTAAPEPVETKTPTAAPEPIETETPGEKYAVEITLECYENLFFSRYDMVISIDNIEIGILDHGATEVFNVDIKEGEHILTAANKDDSSVDGNVRFTVSGEMKVKYKLSCYYDQVEIEKIEDEDTENTEPTEAGTQAEILEQTFPQEYARRAIVVAMTNCQSPEVFAADGNTYDPSLFHSYSDSSGFYMMIYQDGQWTAKDDATWHVDDLILEFKGKLMYMKLYADITYDGNNYLVFVHKRVMDKLEKLDTSTSNDHMYPSDDGVPFLTVPFELIEDDRPPDFPYNGDEPAVTPYQNSDSARSEWIEEQFNPWNGAHYELERLIKENLNDEKSYKHIETIYWDIKDDEIKDYANNLLSDFGSSERVEIGDLLISTKFSAKNAFNATVKCTAIGISSYKYNIVTLVGIE